MYVLISKPIFFLSGFQPILYLRYYSAAQVREYEYSIRGNILALSIYKENWAKKKKTTICKRIYSRLLNESVQYTFFFNIRILFYSTIRNTSHDRTILYK